MQYAANNEPVVIVTLNAAVSNGVDIAVETVVVKLTFWTDPRLCSTQTQNWIFTGYHMADEISPTNHSEERQNATCVYGRTKEMLMISGANEINTMLFSQMITRSRVQIPARTQVKSTRPFAINWYLP